LINSDKFNDQKLQVSHFVNHVSQQGATETYSQTEGVVFQSCILSIKRIHGSAHSCTDIAIILNKSFALISSQFESVIFSFF